MMNRKPGVLVLNGCFPPPYGGIARFLSRVLPLVAKEGRQVWAIMPRQYSQEPYDRFQQEGLRIFVPPKQGLIEKLLIFCRLLPIALDAIICYRLPVRETISTLLQWLPDAENILRTNASDIGIVHAFDAPWAQGWIARYLARKYGKAFVMTTYGEVVPHNDPLVLLDERSYQYQAFCSKILRDADAITSMTAYCASKLDFLGILPTKVWPLHHIVGMEQFLNTPRTSGPLVDKYPSLDGKQLILFCGQLSQRKGPDVLLRSAPHILARHPECMFAFVGPDLGFLEQLQTIAHESRVFNNCLFTGPVSDEELRWFYAAAEVFVFTTIADIECLGLTFVQAMYARCPVVASRISGVPEVLIDGENGLLVEPGNVEQVTAGVLHLLDDKNLAHRLTKQAVADVTSLFSEQKSLEQLEIIYTYVESNR